jgi:hypothetical protein
MRGCGRFNDGTRIRESDHGGNGRILCLPVLRMTEGFKGSDSLKDGTGWYRFSRNLTP